MRIRSGSPPRSTILILFSVVTERDHNAAAAPCCTVSSADLRSSTTGAIPWSCPTLMRCSAKRRDQEAARMERETYRKRS
eukprot:766141-Hanusia_phi.AAC.1